MVKKSETSARPQFPHSTYLTGWLVNIKRPPRPLSKSAVSQSHNGMFHSSEDRQSTATHKKDAPSEHYAAGGQTQKGQVLSEGSDQELTHRPHNTTCSMGRWDGHPGCLTGHRVSWACRSAGQPPAEDGTVPQWAGGGRRGA